MRNLVAFSVAAVVAFSASAFAAKVGTQSDPRSVMYSPSTGLQEGGSTLDVNLAGFSTDGTFSSPLNSSVIVNIGAGSTVTGFEYIGLTFESFTPSWQSEVVLSVEHPSGFASGYLDYVPADGLDSSGVFGPASGVWEDVVSGFGAPFSTATGNVKVYVYEGFADTSASPDATISSGTLRIHYAPIPEPTSLAALGLAGVMIRRCR